MLNMCYLPQMSTTEPQTYRNQVMQSLNRTYVHLCCEQAWLMKLLFKTGNSQTWFRFSITWRRAPPLSCWARKYVYPRGRRSSGAWVDSWSHQMRCVDCLRDVSPWMRLIGNCPAEDVKSDARGFVCDFLLPAVRRMIIYAWHEPSTTILILIAPKSVTFDCWHSICRKFAGTVVAVRLWSHILLGPMLERMVLFTSISVILGITVRKGDYQRSCAWVRR